MLNTPLVLASSSPRRRDLLRCAGLTPKVLKVDIDEQQYLGESPSRYIERMSKTKMQHAQTQWLACQQDTLVDTLLLSADTIGVLPDDTVLTKPKDRQHAFDMWHSMSGTTHAVWTAVCIARLGSSGRVIKTQELLQKTEVTFTVLSDDVLHAYWQTGEPQDKAGGYAIQGKASAWVTCIHGSYSNVVGLPLAQTMMALQQLDTL